MGRLFENLESIKYTKLPGALPLDPKSGAYSVPHEPSAATANVLTHDVLSQQKCLDKALDKQRQSYFLRSPLVVSSFHISI